MPELTPGAPLAQTNDSTISAAITAGKRLVSLDFLRGLTMVLLTLESALLYRNLEPIVEGTWAQPILNQFDHHKWHGLHFWDLIQPTFMFIAGTSLAFFVKKLRKQYTWSETFMKVLKRCFWLFFWGVLDYAVIGDGLYLRLWDVLTQLSFTTLVAFLVMNLSSPVQIFVSFLCLIIPELLFRFTHVPNFDQPFVDQHNFGNYIDTILMNTINKGGWVAINCVSTSAHTIWGVLAGQLLLSNKPGMVKVRYLLVSSAVLFALGFGLDAAGVTPIIKKIATSTFVLASGGWAFLFLAVCYWWIDVKDHQKHLTFFRVFGMNSIFIYLFFEIVGDRWFTKYIFVITDNLFGFVHLSQNLAGVLGALVVFGLETGLLYFLYRKKVFFRL